MQYVSLGDTGLKVSRICLGCMSYGSKKWREWVLEEADSLPFFRQALDAGINFFDTADIYSVGVSEEITGRALKKLGVRREEVVIATKVYNPMGDSPNERGLSKKHIRHAIDASLKRLGVDYVDLYQIHRHDSTTSMEETLEALTDVVNQGKALYIGGSSMYAWEFAKYLYLADQHGYSRFVSMQNHYNLVYREEEREMIPLCRAEGVALIPWSPLARGFLAGNRRGEDKGETVRAKSDEFAHGLYYKEDDFQVVDHVTEIAKKHGVPNAQIALAWILHKPGVTSPIIGATKAHHIPDAVKGFQIKISSEEVAYLEAPYKPHPILGH
ncbi:MAG TPA: aldo/keto reductase [Chthoniobacterales bacterium]|nr:aldo/keto reductase [Chthoniobacterales bacterium]